MRTHLTLAVTELGITATRPAALTDLINAPGGGDVWPSILLLWMLSGSLSGQ
jgi:hypothetical protein